MKALLTLGLPTCVGIVSYAHPDESGKSGSCHARKRFFLALIPMLLLLLGRPTAQPAWAQVPEMMAYQGYLTTADGTPLDDPAAPLTFRLYDAAAGGTAIWTETQAGVAITEGVFSVLLGSVEDLGGVAFDRPLWLGVAVGDASAMELSPRVALEAAPYALSLRGLRVEPVTSTDEAPNLIGGYAFNRVADGIVGATIGGGGASEDMNTVAGDYGTVGGGRDNDAIGTEATVGGGRANKASGLWAAVSGGFDNEAGGEGATVGGGSRNEASVDLATVGGGANNRVEAPYGTIAGGGFNTQAEGNRVTDEGGTVGGGRNNQAGDAAGTTGDAAFATVGGGFDNEAGGEGATVGGGAFHRVTATSGTIGGGGFNGVGNRVTDTGGTVGGGAGNQAGDDAGATDDAPFATVGGGAVNEASASFATIGGGI